MGWVFLVGFMGVGKTTLGQIVARRMAVPFFDLDAAIERVEGKKVAEIFDAVGEAGFRERETDVLRELVNGEPRGIVATGGGTFTVPENRRLMDSVGVSVWLDVPFGAVAARMGARAATRPLWGSDNDARALALERKKHYRLATHRLELGDVSTARNADRLYRLLTRQPSDS